MAGYQQQCIDQLRGGRRIQSDSGRPTAPVNRPSANDSPVSCLPLPGSGEQQQHSRRVEQQRDHEDKTPKNRLIGGAQQG